MVEAEAWERGPYEVDSSFSVGVVPGLARVRSPPAVAVRSLDSGGVADQRISEVCAPRKLLRAAGVTAGRALFCHPAQVAASADGELTFHPS